MPFSLPQNYEEDLDSDSESIFEDELDSSQHSGSQKSENKTEQIARAETRQIWYLQVFVKLVLVVATGLTAFSIFYNLRWEENERFESTFQDHAMNTIDGFQLQFEHRMDALDHFSVMFTSYARVSESEWPFVTLPEFKYGDLA